MLHAVEQTSGTAPCEAEDGPSEHKQTHLPEPTALVFRRQGGAAVEDTVSLPRETETDASKIKFHIGTVAAIVGTAIGVVTAQQLGQAQLKSDVRDILTRMEYQAKVDDADKRAQDVIFETMNKSMTQLERQVQLLQLQYSELSKQISRGQ